VSWTSVRNSGLVCREGLDVRLRLVLRRLLVLREELPLEPLLDLLGQRVRVERLRRGGLTALAGLEIARERLVQHLGRHAGVAPQLHQLLGALLHRPDGEGGVGLEDAGDRGEGLGALGAHDALVGPDDLPEGVAHAPRSRGLLEGELRLPLAPHEVRLDLLRNGGPLLAGGGAKGLGGLVGLGGWLGTRRLRGCHSRRGSWGSRCSRRPGRAVRTGLERGGLAGREAALLISGSTLRLAR
jgi:hypothetical protein